MASNAGSKTSKFFVWIILLLLIIGLGGFGIGGFGRSLNTIGSVGDKDISTNDYVNALRQEIAIQEQQTGSPIDARKAIQLGLDGKALEKLISITALDVELSNIGLSVGDLELAKKLNSIKEFQGQDGNFNSDVYRIVLSQINKSVLDFEKEIRTGISRDILRSSITGGLIQSGTQAKNIYKYISEERTIKTAVLKEIDLSNPIEPPSDNDLETFLIENQEIFRIPEKKRITYAILKPETILDTIQLTEDEITGLYQTRSSIYNTPEYRTIERLAFSDVITAVESKNLMQAGELSFDDLVEQRGLSAGDVEMGSLSKEQLSKNVGDIVFSLPALQTSQVIETELGPAIFRTTKIIDSISKPLEKVRPELELFIKMQKARNQILRDKESFEDLLVGGASLEDLTAETRFQLDTLDFAPGIESEISDKDFIAEVEILDANYFPTLIDLEDGSIIAMQLDKIIPSFVPKLNSIKDDVSKEWQSSNLITHLQNLAEDIIGTTEPNSDWYYLNGKEPKKILLNRSRNNSDISFQLTKEAFENNLNEIQYISGDKEVIIFEVIDISYPDLESETAQAFINEFNRQILPEFENDIFTYFVEALRKELGFKLDRSVINSIHQQF
jgi:peptidyl-prolyl cis-trans isomerase D